MATYTQVDSGTVVAGESRFTSFAEDVQQGEIGQLIRFTGYQWSNVRRYCIRKAVLPFVTAGSINQYPLVGRQDIEQWNPVLFVPASSYFPGARTLLYFPQDSSIVGAAWTVYRVFQ